MEKKEILVIFLLTLLVTGLSLLRTTKGFTTAGQMTEKQIVAEELRRGTALPTQRGYPIPYWIYPPTFCPSPDEFIAVAIGFTIDFLFWFLLLAGGWLVVKKEINHGSQ